MRSLMLLSTLGAAMMASTPAAATLLQYEITGGTNVRFVVDRNPVPNLVEDFPRQKNFRLRPIAGTTMVNGVATDVDLELVFYHPMNMGGMTVSSGRMIGDGSRWDDWESDFLVWMSAETEFGDAFFTGTVQAPTLLTGSWILGEWPGGEITYSMTVTELASEVPEPTGWLLMIGGTALVGGALRRRGATSTRVRFAA